MNGPRAEGRSLRIVRDHDRRLSGIAAETLQDRKDVQRGLSIQVARRLISHDQARIGDDSPGDRLAVAAERLAPR